MPRFYENKYPEVDQLVMVQVQAIEDMGAYVKLVCWTRAICNTLKSARIRQCRGNDFAVRAVAKTYSIRPKVDPSGKKRSRRRHACGPRQG